MPAILAAALAAQACVFVPSSHSLHYADQPAKDAEAAGRWWYIAGEKIDYEGGRYKQYGTSRPIPPGELKHVGEVDKLPVFIPANTRDTAIIYVMSRSWNCTFQPYVRE
jgi:hypothetical protein